MQGIEPGLANTLLTVLSPLFSPPPHFSLSMMHWQLLCVSGSGEELFQFPPCSPSLTCQSPVLGTHLGPLRLGLVPLRLQRHELGLQLILWSAGTGRTQAGEVNVSFCPTWQL